MGSSDKEGHKNVIKRLKVSRPKRGYKRWFISNIWLFLVIAVIIFWILVWTLSDWATPRFSTMVTIAGAAGIAGLMVLTYRFAKYIKELVRATESQSESAKSEVEMIVARAKASIDLARSTGETTKEYNEQLKRMLRPLVVPYFEKEKSSRWEKWDGTFKIRNVGGGPAIYPTTIVKTQAVTHIQIKADEVLYYNRVNVLGPNDDPLIQTIPIKLPVAVRSVVTQHAVKLSYILEIYWMSMYEMGYSKSVLPFYLTLDRTGNPQVEIQKMEIEWETRLDIDEDSVK